MYDLKSLESVGKILETIGGLGVAAVAVVALALTLRAIMMWLSRRQDVRTRKRRKHPSRRS